MAMFPLPTPKEFAAASAAAASPPVVVQIATTQFRIVALMSDGSIWEYGEMSLSGNVEWRRIPPPPVSNG